MTFVTLTFLGLECIIREIRRTKHENKKITLNKVKELLPNFDSYSVRGGVFTVRREFFYTHGVTARHQVLCVQKHIPNVVIVDSGEVWKNFRGGASVANLSHWFVKFTVSE